MAVKKRTRIVSKVLATDSTYIDPINCDSIVSYKVIKRRRVSGSVQLADCYRKIEWYFSSDKKSIGKIDKAIEVLQQFRTSFSEAMKQK